MDRRQPAPRHRCRRGAPMIRAARAIAMAALVMTAAATAHAGTAGVIVEGPAQYRESVARAAASWLRGQNLDLRDQPLASPDARRLLGCYRRNDEECAE